VFPVVADPVDEGSHAHSDELLWSESWYFDFVTTDGDIGGYVRVGHYPNLGAVWYWACLVGDSRPLVAVIDHEVVPPRGGRLELRHSGLWADHVCEEPLERWSLSLEAFAVALDDPVDVYGSMWGDRVPFGFELEWETDGHVFRYPPGLDRYEVPCRVHGGVLVGAESLDIDAVGQRDHSWGVRDWWSIGWCWTAFRLDDGSRWHAVVPEGSPVSIGYVQPAQGEPEGVADAAVAPALGERGIPDGATLSIGGTDFTVDPISWAPVLLRSPDGSVSRFPRAAARFAAVDGRAGVGWIEFNQPQPSAADGAGSAVP
jgi:hypothetical protein